MFDDDSLLYGLPCIMAWFCLYILFTPAIKGQLIKELHINFFCYPNQFCKIAIISTLHPQMEPSLNSCLTCNGMLTLLRIVALLMCSTSARSVKFKTMNFVEKATISDQGNVQLMNIISNKNKADHSNVNDDHSNGVLSEAELNNFIGKGVTSHDSNVGELQRRQVQRNKRATHENRPRCQSSKVL